jgi:hypothetical protein
VVSRGGETIEDEGKVGVQQPAAALHRLSRQEDSVDVSGIGLRYYDISRIDVSFRTAVEALSKLISDKAASNR